MENQELLREIARLESKNDQLQTELDSLDELLRLTGFTRGLASLKEVANQMIYHQEEDEEEMD